MQASIWICTYQMQSIKVHKLAPPTCVLLLSKNFDPSLLFNVAPSLSMSMSYLFKLSYLISPSCTILISKLSYLCIISPPLSSISIKGELLIDAKVYVWGRWLRLESYIFYGHHLYSSLDTMCRILWSWYQLVEHLPLCPNMGHSLDNLELL